MVRCAAVSISVIAALAAFAAPAALACKVDTTLDKPSYPPGSLALITGYATGPGAESATIVRFTWGERGPLLGEAPVAADGAISFSFTVPADLAAGSYPIYAEAYDASGASLSPLPGSMLLVVTSPAAPGDAAGAEESEPLPAKAVAVVLQDASARKEAAPRVPARAAQPHASARPQSAKASHSERTETLARRARVTPAGVSPARPSGAVRRSLPNKPAGGERARARHERALRAPHERALRAPPTTLRVRAEPVRPTDEAASRRAAPWVVLIVLALGACAVALLLRRRATAGERARALRAADAIETELQEIIAEERARRDLAERR